MKENGIYNRKKQYWTGTTVTVVYESGNMEPGKWIVDVEYK